MPRLYKTSTSPVFIAKMQEAAQLGETNDCAVKALSIVMDVPYAEVHKVLAELGRKDRKGTFRSQTERCLKHFGFSVTYAYAISFIKQYPKAHRILKNVTTHHPRRFPKVWAQYKDAPMLFFTAGHVAAFKDGVVHDWTVNHSKPVEIIWMIRKV